MDASLIAVAAVVSLGLGWLLRGARHTCKANIDRDAPIKQELKRLAGLK